MSLTRASYLLKDALQRAKQHVRGLNRKRLYKRRLKRGHNYSAWLASHAAEDQAAKQNWLSWSLGEPKLPTFGVVRSPDVSNTFDIHSKLQDQRYQRWSCETSPQQSHADWLLFLAPEDQLDSHALLAFARAAAENPDAGLIYCDHDRLGDNSVRTEPSFKPRWNAPLQQSTGYVGNSFVVRRDIYTQASSFGEWTKDAFDYELVLRCAEVLGTRSIINIPHVLWHRQQTGEKPLLKQHSIALQRHLDRIEPGSRVVSSPCNTFRITYPLPAQLPLVSILICTRNQYQLLKTCLDSIQQKTEYGAYEIIVVDNGSTDPRTLDYLRRLNRDSSRIKVIRDDSPFNYSALNNLAARHASGTVYALLNNDIEVIEPGWLTEMVSHALRADTGCVGARLLYPNETIQHAGILLGGGDKVDGLGIATHYFRGLPKEDAGYQKRAIATAHVSAVTGACLVIRKDTFDLVGGLNDRELAVAYNDVDFCLRVSQLGLRHTYAPFATLYHHESISRGRDQTAEKQARFANELRHMRERWAEQLKEDPCYSPNLNSTTGDFLL